MNPIRARIGLLFLAAAAMVGCGGTSTTANGGGSTPVTPVASLVHGAVTNGALPLQSASVQLYTVGASGLASAAAPLLANAVTTDATGAFSFPLPACGSATLVYLSATGGSSGAGANGATSLLAALGPCSALTSSSSFHIDELTTVATVFALAPFIADAAHIGASGNVPAGLANAFSMVNALVNTTSGAMPGPTLATSATAPVATLNTLANILAGCIRTASPTSSACAPLLTATSSADTLGATLRIAHQPASYPGLYALAANSTAYSPSLTAAPTDWTLALRIAASGLATPFGIAIDGAGNGWVTNESAASLVQLSPAGTTLLTVTGSGLLAPRGVAIDRSGNLWVANTGADSVLKLSSTGSLLAKASTGLNAPTAIANDSAGNAWVANTGGNSVIQLSSTGIVLTNTIGLSAPSGIALDSAGNVWVANTGADNVLQMTHAGALSNTVSDGVTQAPGALAIDSNSNLWFTGSVPSQTAVQGALAKVASSDTASAPVLSMAAIPGSIATSGADIWVANAATGGGLMLFHASSNAPLSPAAGFGSLNAPAGIAVDASGNVWVACAGDNTVSIFLGLTTPVMTPLAQTVGP
ncbi:Streptogramin lyase [Granulicella rosea]|uniref:Streptogramin lyase n=1 Tax=Granulicella rosea TaxID=474952 RepID=A0A239LXL8_9BACT|nr:NHL repeat-containing protein [Granulicella rosea]SNT34384.1 Streptogramin lyase [Granulicella rosea]